MDERNLIENNVPETIPYLVHESEVARLERTIKRLFILCVLLIIVAVGTNAYWIWFESQWTDEVITQEIQQDSGDGGTSNYRIFCVVTQFAIRRILRTSFQLICTNRKRGKMIYGKVKQACAERGETISGLEEKLGFPRGSIYKWDENIPSVLKVQKVATALEKPIEYFLTEDESNG